MVLCGFSGGPLQCCVVMSGAMQSFWTSFENLYPPNKHGRKINKRSYVYLAGNFNSNELQMYVLLNVRGVRV